MFVDDGYMGGFSNSLAFFNEAFTWTHTMDGFRTIIPHFEVTALHNSAGHLFEDAFLAADQEPYLGNLDDIQINQIKTFECSDVGSLITNEEQEEWQKMYNPRFKRFKQRCPIAWLRYHISGQTGRVDDANFLPLIESHKGAVFHSDNPVERVFNGCSLFLRPPGEAMFYHHDYTVSAPYLYSLYHARWQLDIPPWVRAMYEVDDSPADDRIVVGAHNRLGDVYRSIKKHIKNDNGLGRWYEKLMPPTWAVFNLYLMEAIIGDEAKNCILFHVFADANQGHPFLTYIREALNEKDIPFWIHGFETNSRHALDGMAFSDVLIVGTSGFGRVASVFNRGMTVAPRLDFHPLKRIDGVYVVEEPEELLRMDEMEKPALLHALARSNIKWIQELRTALKAGMLRRALAKGGEKLASRCNLI